MALPSLAKQENFIKSLKKSISLSIVLSKDERTPNLGEIRRFFASCKRWNYLHVLIDIFVLHKVCSRSSRSSLRLIFCFVRKIRLREWAHFHNGSRGAFTVTRTRCPEESHLPTFFHHGKDPWESVRPKDHKNESSHQDAVPLASS